TGADTHLPVARSNLGVVIERRGLFLALLPAHRASTPFPYTTLFRSLLRRQRDLVGRWAHRGPDRPAGTGCGGRRVTRTGRVVARSEEHTSELQSREKLVCRLLPRNKNHRPGHLPAALQPHAPPHPRG